MDSPGVHSLLPACRRLSQRCCKVLESKYFEQAIGLRSPSLNFKVKKPQQKRSKETRLKIIDAARQLFEEVGFDATTTTLIAERAGVSIGGIYARFNNKMEMFWIILDQNSRETFRFLKNAIDRALEQHKDLNDSLAAIIPDIYQAYRINDKLSYEISRFIVMNQRAKEIHDYWEKQEHKELKRYFSFFLKSASPEDIEAAVTVVHQATHGLFSFMYQNEAHIDEERILRRYTDLLTGQFLKHLRDE